MSSKNIVIVESPSKSRTIEGYLGSDYQVLATFGHIRDLPKSELGVDVEHNFEPRYIIPTKSKKTISQLKSACAAAETVYLATDYDREGEAIAWHVMKAIGLEGSKAKKVFRITFHEITKTALEKAIQNPRQIDEHLVDAQQARRILDRLVGYKLSPFLWKKVIKGLSAGRVQSVAVRIIVDREREIEAFKPQEYWSVDGVFNVKQGQIVAGLTRFKNETLDKLGLKNQEDSKAAIKDLENDSYSIGDIVDKKEKRNPYPPYTTSTLQQDANKRLRYTSKRTMRLAQDLYEAGLITYMRTDSTQIAQVAIDAARSFVTEKYGAQYRPTTARVFKTKSKGAQEAHEAIRPTDPHKTVESLGTWTPQHKDLYTLIWQRFMASQMAEAQIDRLTISILGKSSGSVFTANGQRVAFEGFLKVYPLTIEDKELPKVTKAEKADLKELKPEQHFTQPPARFTEASLVKLLEELGIGRPSTYAPTISTVIDRGYVRLEKNTFYPQEIGFIVTDLLKEHFPEIVDSGFTAAMEEDLDEIAEGRKDWTKVIDKFWQPFSKLLEKKQAEVTKQDLTKEIGEKCPECSKPLVERLGKFGKFIACSGFPECKYSRQIVNDSGVACPECKTGSLIERRTRKGNRLFWGCNKFPKCKYATWNDPAKQPVAESVKV